MTTNQDIPYHAATFVDNDNARLWLYRKTSAPEVRLTVMDHETGLAVNFRLDQLSLDRLITSLQRESKLLKAPKVGERRRAPADHPELSGCEVIRADDADRSGPLFGAESRRWFVYRGSAVGAWTTNAEVADWTVIQ